MSKNLYFCFTKAWNVLRGDTARPEVYALLEARYNEKHRAYHTLKHIHHGLEELTFATHHLEFPAEVQIAWFFHDAVYDIQRKDNEEQSVALAKKFLTESHIDISVTDRIGELILTTKHTKLPEKNDEKFMVDIDLAILGQQIEIFDAYEINIRREYSQHYTQKEIDTGRAVFLVMFLKRAEQTSIYATNFFREKYESQARQNLRRALEKLKGT